MMDITTGRIEYLVIQFGGFLGVSIKYFAIHLVYFALTQTNGFLYLIGARELEKAPGFDMDHWPGTNIHFDEVHSYWSFMG
jgi:hypothetical protein